MTQALRHLRQHAIIACCTAIARGSVTGPAMEVVDEIAGVGDEARQEIIRLQDRVLELERQLERQLTATVAATAVTAGAVTETIDPHGCHVYVLWDQFGAPLYVGQSTNILNRLGTHMVAADRRYKVRRITITRCPDGRSMDLLEARLIAKHQPPLNTVGIRR